MAETEAKEHWSWSKFLLGFFDGKNYAKAMVFGFCLFIMLMIGYATTTFIKSKIVKPMPTIGTNSGTVTNTSTDKKSWSLFNLFNF